LLEDFDEEKDRFLIQSSQNKKYGKYILKSLDSIEYKEVSSLEEKKWGEFFIEDIATIKPGRDIYDAERVVGNTPYVSSTAKNNGIGYFVDNTNATLADNCLSVNRNGSIGYSFYHPYKALFSNDCRRLKPKNGLENVSFFIANQITMQKDKYNYGYKMGTGRLKRQFFLLPVYQSGEPDYEYMDQYIKNIKYNRITQYLNYIDSLESI
jgi:hypothetical protein